MICTPAEVPNPKSEEAKPSRDFLQQLVEALLVQTPLTSKFGLYRAFLEEYQSAAQGSMGNLVKRLASVAQQQQFQRQQEDLENKNKAIEEQTAQLHAMTADRDKWMLHSQNLLVSESWMQALLLPDAPTVHVCCACSVLLCCCSNLLQSFSNCALHVSYVLTMSHALFC